MHFVNATYYLGDGPLIFTCFERLSAVSYVVAVGHYPCTLAITREIAIGDAALQNRLITQAKDCVQPGLNFFQQKFNLQFLTNVPAFKAAHLCCPVQVSALRPDAHSLEELKNFRVEEDPTIANLATAHRDNLPHRVALVRKFLLIQPSSAAAERVFSFLNTLSAQQEGALEDYIEASVMIRYNNNQRKL